MPNCADRSSTVVFHHNGKILLIKEQESPHKIGFPKGYIEMNESSWMSACRHLKGETGIDLRQVKHKRLNWHPILVRLPYRKNVAFYKIQLVEEPLAHSEELIWKTKEELAKQVEDKGRLFNMPLRKFITKM